MDNDFPMRMAGQALRPYVNTGLCEGSVTQLNPGWNESRSPWKATSVQMFTYWSVIDIGI